MAVSFRIFWLGMRNQSLETQAFAICRMELLKLIDTSWLLKLSDMYYSFQ